MSLSLGRWTAAFTGVQVGSAMVATRALADDLGPMTLALLRYALAVVILMPFFLRLNALRIARADLVPVLVLGVVQFGVLIALLNFGLTRVSAAQGATIFATFPLLTVLLAVSLGREALSMAKLIGAVLSILGVAICLGLTDLTVDPLGAAAVLAAALCGAICAICYRPYLMRYPTLQIGTLAMIAAVMALLPGALFEMPLTALAHLPLQGWLLIGFIGLSSGVGYMLWLTALKHAPASEASILLGLSPVTAVLAGILFLSEPVTFGFVLGLVVLLVGVSLALRG